MQDLIRNASDDQIALTVCFAAVAISGLVMYFSYHVGAFTRKIRPGTVPMRMARANIEPEVAALQPVREKAA